MENKITLREAAKRANVSSSTIYHYIKMGVLPKPEHISNEKAGRGNLAVYSKDIVEIILRVKSELENTHSLKMVQGYMCIPEETRKNSLNKKLKKLLHMVKIGKYKEPEFYEELNNVKGLIGASMATASLYDGSTFAYKFSHKKQDLPE